MQIVLRVHQLLAVVAVCTAMTAVPAASGKEISVLCTSDAYTSGQGSGNKAHVLSFDPGDQATAIIVIAAAETSGDAVSVQFNRVNMKQVIPLQRSNVGIYYLNGPAVGQASDLLVDYTGVETVNFIAFQAFSLRAAAGIQATASATDVDFDVSLEIPYDDNLVLAGFNFNEGPATPCADFLLLCTFGRHIFSGGASFGYQNYVRKGQHQFSFSTDKPTSKLKPRKVTAVSFHVAP